MKRLMLVLSVIAMTCVATGTASASLVISTPSGLNPGDHFRLVFVTTDTMQGKASDFATYDNFVTTEANGATYNGSVITWQAIVSSSTVNAKDHIGGTGDAVYLVDGSKVAKSDNSNIAGSFGLWSGTLKHDIVEDINGVMTYGKSWTGTLTDGTKDTGATIGSTYTNTGSSTTVDSQWVNFGTSGYTNQKHVYGISQELTVPPAVVPEPSTAMLAGLGGIAIAIRAYRRHQANVATRG